MQGGLKLKQCKHIRHRRGGALRLPILLVVLAIIGGFGFRYYITHRVTEPVPIDMVGNIPVYEKLIPEGAAARPRVKRHVSWIVIHETDNEAVGADAESHSRYLQTNGLTEAKSWHYTVDDHEIYHNLPDDEAAYHAADGLDDGGGNKNGIGIEMCVNADGDYEKTLENTVQLTAKLMHAYQLSIENVKKHQDFSGKICPSRLIQNDRWSEFLDRVQTAYDES